MYDRHGQTKTTRKWCQFIGLTRQLQIRLFRMVYTGLRATCRALLRNWKPVCLSVSHEQVMPTDYGSSNTSVVSVSTNCQSWIVGWYTFCIVCIVNITRILIYQEQVWNICLFNFTPWAFKIIENMKLKQIMLA